VIAPVFVVVSAFSYQRIIAETRGFRTERCFLAV